MNNNTAPRRNRSAGVQFTLTDLTEAEIEEAIAAGLAAGRAAQSASPLPKENEVAATSTDARARAQRTKEEQAAADEELWVTFTRFFSKTHGRTVIVQRHPNGSSRTLLR